jgi:transcriptional regulator PpsR
MDGSHRKVAFGRDLRADARLQQRLVEAHQDLERDYARLREAETRYRLLFDSVTQPVLIVDSASRKIEEANPATVRILGRSADELTGQVFSSVFDPASQATVDAAIADTLAAGQTSGIEVHTPHGDRVALSMSSFRLDRSTNLIVRLEGEATGAVTEQTATALSVIETLPDGLVVVGADLRILAANAAFAEMTHLASPGQPIGGSLGDYLGRSATDLNVLVSNLKNHGVVRNFNTVVKDRFGHEDDVEVSAVSATHDGQPAYGMSIRAVARRLRATPRMDAALPSSADQLTSLVGRVPLREIVRQSTDFIERLCIEAALEITNNNRASASEMLGLSRQGLYSKLRRFGRDD